MNLHGPTKRVLDILLLLSKNEEGLSYTEISKFANIPKSTISPILKTLIEMQFVQLNSYNRYTIGINTFKVGGTFLSSISGIDIVRSFMEEIVKECNEICQLGIYNNKEVLYLEKIEPSRSIQLVSNVGMSLPAHATALGKSLLIQFTNDELKEIYKDGFITLTKNTIDNIDDLIIELENIRRNGYAYEIGEASEEIECISVPLESNKKVVAAISVSMPTFRKSEKKFSDIKKLLLKYKSIIESNIEKIPLDLG